MDSPTLMLNKRMPDYVRKLRSNLYSPVTSYSTLPNHDQRAYSHNSSHFYRRAGRGYVDQPSPTVRCPFGGTSPLVLVGTVTLVHQPILTARLVYLWKICTAPLVVVGTQLDFTNSDQLDLGQNTPHGWYWLVLNSCDTNSYQPHS